VSRAPDNNAAAWLRSGVSLLKADLKRAGIKAHTLPDAALKVPVAELVRSARVEHLKYKARGCINVLP
jgi:hypothetical protein